MNVEREINQLGESIQEIITSAKAVKGEPFAQAVGVHFETTQMMEIIGRIAYVADDEHREYVESLLNVCMEVLSSIACKACPNIDAEQFTEASDLAQTLYERRNRTIAAMKKKYNGEGPDA